MLVTIISLFITEYKALYYKALTFIEDDNKLVTKIESPIGHIYYDDTLDDVNARIYVTIINNDNKIHKVTFILDSNEYRQYNFINSDFKFSGIYEWYPEDISNDAGIDGRFIGEREIVLQVNEKKYLTIRATANFGGVKDYRRAGPPVELKILE